MKQSQAYMIDHGELTIVVKSHTDCESSNNNCKFINRLIDIGYTIEKAMTLRKADFNSTIEYLKVFHDFDPLADIPLSQIEGR